MYPECKYLRIDVFSAPKTNPQINQKVVSDKVSFSNKVDEDLIAEYKHNPGVYPTDRLFK